MALFRKKLGGIYDADSDINSSSASRVAERMVRVFRAAGLDSYSYKSRKSASHYVTVERLDGGKEDRVEIRISNHYLPDRYLDLEMDIDYQVFTSDMEALAETVRAVLKRFGVPEPKELATMLRRSASQKGKPKRRRTREQILMDKAAMIAEEWEKAADMAEFSDIEWHGTLFKRLVVPSRSMPVIAYLDKGEWKSSISHGSGRSKVSAEVSVPAGFSDSAPKIAAEIVRLWKEKIGNQ